MDILPTLRRWLKTDVMTLLTTDGKFQVFTIVVLSAFMLSVMVYDRLHPEEMRALEQRQEAERLAAEKSKMDEAKAAARLQDEAMSAINTQLLVAGFSSPRLQLDGGSLDAYVRKNDFESIPFPDRRKFIEDLGKVWCEKGSSGLLPTLGFYDIRTGEKFGAYSCTLSRATLS